MSPLFETVVDLSSEAGTISRRPYGVIETKEMVFRYISAGHPPICYLQKSEQPTFIEVESFPIGFVDKPAYAEQVVRLSAGDRLLLYSDGITESSDQNGTVFGSQRLKEMLEEGRTATLSESLRIIQKSVEDWCSPLPLHDDISLLGVEILC